jgi:hypothetical protein
MVTMSLASPYQRAVLCAVGKSEKPCRKNANMNNFARKTPTKMPKAAMKAAF